MSASARSIVLTSLEVRQVEVGLLALVCRSNDLARRIARALRASFWSDLKIARRVDPNGTYELGIVAEEDLRAVGQDVTGFWVGPWIVVTRASPENLRVLATWPPVVGLVLIDSLEEELTLALSREFTMRPWARLAAEVSNAHKLPAALRTALRIGVLMAAGGTDGRVATTLKGLANASGCSVDYLRKAAKLHGIDLLTFLSACLACRAVSLRRLGRTWEEVAWTMGYASTSGVSELLARALGVRPRALDQQGTPEMPALVRDLLGECLS